MAESLLLPVVRGVAGKAADALVQSVTGMWGVDGDRGKLERQLLAVHLKLADAEVKSETAPAIKRWMKDLKAVAYEADDVLDDFQYEALRREAQIGESTRRKVLGYFTHQSPFVFRLTMSWKLRNVLKKIDELVVEMNKFSLAENRAEVPQVLYRQTHSGLDEYSEIFGRDEDKEVVIKLLLDQRDQQQVQVLPIIGMGGLGKTTLAKMVYNDRRVQTHFELKMWHCVSENFDACPLVKSIIELAKGGTCGPSDTIEQLRKQLLDAIGRKRFLLVLDDVWNEDERKWEDDLKPLLCSDGGPGSVIVVTSRSQQVASIMGTLQPHEPSCLSQDNSWELFSKKAFSKGVEEKAELVIIGKRIVEKCKGLPLALKTMGGLMSSKQQVQEWEAIEESNVGDNGRGKDEILPILKLSYRHLSSETKQCFAFCAVFPKDYEMDKGELIQLWMANGFIQEEGTMDLAQKGELIFHDLVWRSFLQDVKPKQLHFSPATTYESVGCKMHDLMHDLAKDVTDECATIEELIQQKSSIKDVRHMQKLTAELEQSRGVLKGTTSLRTLVGPLTSHKDRKEFKLTSLRALCCYNPSIIHSKVINAKHLRYLDLSRSNIVSLPNSICVMYNLQSLRLNGCRDLKYLPDDMRTLRKLIHLYLFGCTILERMPPNVSLLKNLHTLTTFVVDTEVGRGIEELKDLRHLGNRLELYNLRKIKSWKNAKEANLQQKQNLTELLLYWGREQGYMPEDEITNDGEVLESLAPHSELQILEVHGYGGLEISQWMSDPQKFRCLRKLHISNCPRCEDLPVVWLSVSLECLSLCNMGGLTTLRRSIQVEAEGYNTPVQFFPKLRVLFLSELPNLERWAERNPGEPNSRVMFPQLEKLIIWYCPKLASVPVSPVLKDLDIKGCCSLPISSLAHLTTLSELEYKVQDRTQQHCPLGSWPSLAVLKVSSLSNMMVMPLEDQQSQSQTALENLWSLRLNGPDCFVTAPSLSKPHLGLWECFAFVEELNIWECDELVCWPVDELRCLVRLRSLSIWNCAKLEGKGSSSEEILPLPQLQTLLIHGCGSLLEIPKLPASLERLEMYFCHSLVALPSNLGNLAKLRMLDMKYCKSLVALPNLGNLAKLRMLDMKCCSGLKTLPDGMGGLTSLERLFVWGCRGMEKFPEGLLQRLPTLKSLTIGGCPDLQRRCGEGGEYFHLVSSVPHKIIRAVEPNNKKKKRRFLKRLLPSC